MPKPTVDLPRENSSGPTVTPELVKEHGLTPEEFARIKKILGREPNFTVVHCPLLFFKSKLVLSWQLSLASVH